MIYTSKEECYSDILLSLTTGLILEEDLGTLRMYYEDIEHYECCQGIAEAYRDYKKLNYVRQGD
jgi:hypothetical protein